MIQEQNDLRSDALVGYKGQLARVVQVGTKIRIRTDAGKQIDVRQKDITLIHPGPDTGPQTVDSEHLETLFLEACELFEGQHTDLREIAELMGDEFTAATARYLVGKLDQGMYLEGTPDNLRVRSASEIEEERIRLEEQEKKRQEHESFLKRVASGKLLEEDRSRFFDVENLALGNSPKSRLLGELGIGQEMEKAHKLLLDLGIWSESFSPFLSRMGFSVPESYRPLEPEQEVPREDLRHLRSLAIDDEGNTDPDDAISIEDDTLWIHIADVSCSIPHGCEADRQACELATNLYLPDRSVRMLDRSAVEQYGLGLESESKALSFAVKISEDGSIGNVRIVHSVIKVTRMTYAQADTQIDEDRILARIWEKTEAYRRKRLADGAIELSFPEVRIRVDEAGTVMIAPLTAERSRQMVSNAMILAGQAAASYAVEHQIPMIYSTQMPPDGNELPELNGLLDMYAMRRKMKGAMVSTEPDIHAGLGIPYYTKVTSPLRRYPDLLVHQQLSAALSGQSLLTEEELLLDAGPANERSREASRLERMTNQYYTCLYLKQNPGFTASAIVVDSFKYELLILIPSIGFEATLKKDPGLQIGDELSVSVEHVDLATSRAQFSYKRS